ncbi:MAG TPA: hypothetical protein VMP08_12805 [Anaerolineae bacterium]|nr:hypothetical protein [Anaerolineae bacterium]
MPKKMPTPEDLHTWTVSLRFKKNAKSVTVTWQNDDPAIKPIKKTVALLSQDGTAGPAEYLTCLQNCGGDPLCPVVCLGRLFS